MLLLVEGSTGGERKEFLGGEGQKEFAPEEMEHIQVCQIRPQGIDLIRFLGNIRAVQKRGKNTWVAGNLKNDIICKI